MRNSSLQRNIGDDFQAVEVGGGTFLECLECPARYSINTLTMLGKHFNSYHVEKGEEKTAAEDGELMLLDYFIECNIPFNTL